MNLREAGKVMGGLAIGKLEKYGLGRVGISFPMFGVDLVKVGLGVAQIAVAIWGERRFVGMTRDITDFLGVAGAGLIVDEVAKATGINPGSPQIVVNRRYTPIVTTPSPTLVKVD